MLKTKALLIAILASSTLYGAMFKPNSFPSPSLFPSPSQFISPFTFPTPTPSSRPSPEPASHSGKSHVDAPIICYRSAIRMGLSTHQGIYLCTSAKSQDPIRCFQDTPGPLTTDQLINLCEGATSSGPSRCFEESWDVDLSYDQRIKLCGTANLVDEDSPSGPGQTTPYRCFRRSLRLPLTQDQRVDLCAGADSDDPARCFVRADDLDLTLDQRDRLCSELSPSAW